MPVPVGAVITIVPVATAQVGCCVTDAVGAAGGLLTIIVTCTQVVLPQSASARTK